MLFSPHAEKKNQKMDWLRKPCLPSVSGYLKTLVLLNCTRMWEYHFHRHYLYSYHLYRSIHYYIHPLNHFHFYVHFMFLSFPIALSAFACKACIIAMFRSKQELRVSLRRRSEIWNVEVSGGADTFLSTVWSSSLSEVVFYIDGSIARLLFEVKRGDRDIRLTAERACTDFWKWRLTESDKSVRYRR